jgi:hypothetical protein
VVLRNSKLKCCVIAISQYSPEPPAVILNSGATDPQLLAHALRVCHKERLEKMIEAPRLEPDPGVLHCHEYFVGFMLNGLISKSRDRSVAPPIASMPSITRFKITRCDCTRSPKTRGRSEASSIRSTTPFFLYFILYQTNHFLNDLMSRRTCSVPLS